MNNNTCPLERANGLLKTLQEADNRQEAEAILRDLHITFIDLSVMAGLGAFDCPSVQDTSSKPAPDYDCQPAI